MGKYLVLGFCILSTAFLLCYVWVFAVYISPISTTHWLV